MQDSLSVDEYCINLEHLARNGLRGISFSGGEPTLNSDLPKIVARAAELFDRVELTTNGRFLTKMIPSLTPYLDILKVSLDAVDSQLAHAINNGSMEDVERAVAAIRSGCSAGIRVGVNVVVMRSTVNQIEDIIDLCKKVNSEGLPGKVYVSLLDFYYSEERRLIWEQEFFPIVELEARFISRYGPNVVQERFGCRFFLV
jgi:molybdenum cofactor biosynthesis enzyme MoaA